MWVIKWSRIKAGIYEGFYNSQIRFTIRKINKRIWMLDDLISRSVRQPWQYVTLTGAQGHAEAIVYKEEKRAAQKHEEQFKDKIGEELYRWVEGLEHRIEYLEDEIRRLR